MCGTYVNVEPSVESLSLHNRTTCTVGTRVLIPQEGNNPQYICSTVHIGAQPPCTITKDKHHLLQDTRSFPAHTNQIKLTSAHWKSCQGALSVPESETDRSVLAGQE